MAPSICASDGGMQACFVEQACSFELCLGRNVANNGQRAAERHAMQVLVDALKGNTSLLQSRIRSS